MSHFDWKLLRRKKVIPADRRPPEKEETWTLATDQQDSCTFFDGTVDSKVKDAPNSEKAALLKPPAEVISVDASENVDHTLPRSQETRKSKTKKVKSYLKKCKGALSKGDESVTEKKRQECCTSWYLEDVPACASQQEDRDEPSEKYTEFPEERLEGAACAAESVEDPAPETLEENFSRGENLEETSHEALARLLEEDRRADLSRSRTSLYEDVGYVNSERSASDRKTSTKEPEVFRDEEKKVALSLETLTTEDTNLNKCDSSDTLIAEVPETTENATDLNTELIVVKEGATSKELADDELPVPTFCGNRGDFASLVRNLLGPIYGDGVMNLLIRQARDILVCAYHGNLENFVRTYLSPAAALLVEVKNVVSETGNEAVVPEGWPLTLGGSGLILQLGELEASALRLGECYLCVRSAAAATATATTSSVNGATAAGEVVEQNTVEIAVVWRTTSMRAPGILGWDREDEFMDWRDLTNKGQPSSSNTAGANLSGAQPPSVMKTTGLRPRRRSREDARSRTRETNRTSSTEHRRDEARSIDRLEYQFCRESRAIGEPGHTATVMKSKSASSVDTWKEDLDDELDRGSSRRARSKNSSSPTGSDESRAKVKRCAKVVSPTTMEKWKESSRCEMRSKPIAPGDLKSPLQFEESVLRRDNIADDLPKDLEDRLRNANGPDDVSDEDLPAYISSLLVTVERKIERVSLDDMTFPCPACRNIDTDDPLLGCRCAGDDCGCGVDNCDCSSSASVSRKEPSAKSFEVAGIKHIDSDDEEEVRMGFGTKKRIDDVVPPRTIHDLPEHVLTCSLSLPGYFDVAGRPVIEFEDNLSARETLSVRETSSFLLYLARLPSSDRTKDGFTIFIRGDSKEILEFVDSVLVLLQGRINVAQALVLRNATATDGPVNSLLPLSSAQTVIVNDATLAKYIPRREGNHDQMQWIAFYKEYDSLMTEWQSAGRRLALEMSELKECTSLSGTLTPLGRLLTDPTLRRTSRDAEEAIAALEERAAPLLNIEHVRLSVKRARRLVEEVGKAATRLESSFESRRATIRNLAVLRSIEDQAHEILSWLCKKGEDILSKHAQHAAANLTSARLHEREFEKFYFTSMRHLDKGSDLAEAASASGLRELARSLKQHLRGFGSRLEDRREYLEDTSRCCLLQDRAYEWAQEARLANERRSQQFLMARPPLPPEHFTEMMALAEKLGNEVLLEQCRIARNKCAEALEIARTTSAPGSPARRRSFTASESTSWDDTLAKRTSWDDSDSSASYACPMESVGSAGSGGRPVLDNIAELRESAEQLLDCSPPRTPPRSPAPRRLVKPPVNSHLHRSASIAPGMKAKKTILLIMREMIQTERDYVKSLEYIIENYIPELVREDIPQALRGQRNVIFGNVEKIYEFHSQHFLRELEQCEQSPMLVGQCFLRHEKKFYLYALYNKNKPNSDSLMAEYGSSFFKQKQLELGDKMDLASYLLKPVQRMGKYALLLQQLVKAGTDLSEQLTGKEEKDEKEDGMKPMVEGETDLRAAEQMVRFQLRHGNDLLAMDSLRDCDVNVKEQGRLLRQNEFLVWQGKGKKCLRQVFLFEDLILFSKARRFPDRKNLDIYIYKHSIKTTDIGLTAVIADSPTKFEIWFRKRKPGDTYTLQCASEDIKKAWTEELSNLLWKQALRNREVRLAEMSSMGIGNKPCLDIRPSADQINDRSISVAQLSKTPRFRNSIAVSMTEDSSRCSRRPHSVISVSSSSSSGGSSGPPTTLNLGLDTSPRPHHRSTTLNSQCSVESGIIADISIVSDDGGDGTERSHWNSTLESPTSLPTTSTPLQSPTSATAATVTPASSTDTNLTSYDQDMSINL
ncbi:pleckstrin homology domain-containing family G member 4B isoform X2 [Cardiocondyla obscurior]|uniref:pleckstrin homology domain-containing family G member 4B isoform X2 n=1 Tax=Cardiocondyla obscurior TaxID=286306 RepID=UPI003965651A